VLSFALVSTSVLLGSLSSAILWTWPYHVSWFCSISLKIVSSSFWCVEISGSFVVSLSTIFLRIFYFFLLGTRPNFDLCYYQWFLLHKAGRHFRRISFVISNNSSIALRGFVICGFAISLDCPNNKNKKNRGTFQNILVSSRSFWYTR
jgi:hypothetical protein